MPKAFISYSWEDEEHRTWVREFATRLRADGIETIIDQWNAIPGDQLPAFMESAIRSNDYVLIVCTPKYKQKSDNRQGGVGYEGDIMTAEVLGTANHRKFIPVLRKGSWSDSAPTWLGGKYFIDLSASPYSEENYGDLLVTMHGVRNTPPPVGKPFSTVQPNPAVPHQEKKDETQDIRIEGVIADQVTTPRMDGTAGSALYRVPFKLSRRPDREWADLLVNNWNHPSSFTSMHRPGIASVVGDTIVLDGTTLDEVKRYHRDTLKLALAAANRQYNELQANRLAAAERERARIEAHRADVAKQAGDISFD
ncbi:toll/interleukin-1 receptor domain-containing protein [Thermomonas fusca]